MANFDEFLQRVTGGITDLARQMISDFKDQAIDDAKSFVEDTREDIQRWTMLLAKGDLRKDEFEFLTKSKKDLFKLHALTQAGATLITVQKFRDAVIDLVINTAVDVFL